MQRERLDRSRLSSRASATPTTQYAPQSDSGEDDPATLADFENALEDAENMQGEVESAMTDLGDSGYNRDRLENVRRQIESQMEPHLHAGRTPPRSRTPGTPGANTQSKALEGERQARESLARELDASGSTRSSRQSDWALAQQQAQQRTQTARDDTTRSPTRASEGAGNRHPSESAKEKADDRVAALEAQVDRLRGQLDFQGKISEKQDRVASPTANTTGIALDSPLLYHDVDSAQRAVSQAEQQVVVEADGLRELLLEGLNEFADSGDVPVLDWQVGKKCIP